MILIAHLTCCLPVDLFERDECLTELSQRDTSSHADCLPPPMEYTIRGVYKAGCLYMSWEGGVALKQTKSVPYMATGIPLNRPSGDSTHVLLSG